MSTSIAIQLIVYGVAVVAFAVSTRAQLTGLKEFLQKHEDREMVVIQDLRNSFSAFNDKNDKAHGELHAKIDGLSSIVYVINGKIGNGR